MKIDDKTTNQGCQSVLFLTVGALLLAVFFCDVELHGDLLIGSPETQSVRRFDDQGNFLGDFVASGSGGISIPSGLAIGPDGNLYVSDGPSGRVLRFNGRSGAFIDVFAEDVQLVGPTDLEFRGDDLFVGMWNQSTFQGGVSRLNATTGKLEQAFGITTGRTHAIEFDSAGNLYASHFDAGRVSVYDSQTGALINAISGSSVVGSPMGLSFDAGGRLLVNDWGGTLRAIDVATGALDEVLISGLNNTQWHAIAPDGSLIVDSFNDEVLRRYDPMTGAFLGEFANLGFQPEKFIFINSVPEPGSATLLMVGVLVCGLQRHRRV